ncbi:hypothetical protein R5H30_19260 [Sulfitobacter sp. D35]|uniref:hypothetical protein n=1 Tax=Sulfitobacter sp. D35 TaxID=3083252 RepID=UPI00296FF41C|nr:hypothetical protein [Sulfitobacter sp. D35]MDW4500134.1 hypothetical protein [Sulfitobacter sp. D35]
MFDDPTIVAGMVSAAIGLLTALVLAIVNTGLSRQTESSLRRMDARIDEEKSRRERLFEKQDIVARYRDPLLHAAFDLQSRIYNISEQGFLQRYLANGNDREQKYAVENTVFLVAQFLGWTELVRQDIRFMEMEEQEKTQALRKLQDGVYASFQTDALGPVFRLFAGEQRAVGELMIRRETGGSHCLGYASFLTGRPPEMDRWLDPLREDIQRYATSPVILCQRLVPIQHSLIDILALLDPGHVYFPEASRTKIEF